MSDFKSQQEIWKYLVEGGKVEMDISINLPVAVCIIFCLVTAFFVFNTFCSRNIRYYGVEYLFSFLVSVIVSLIYVSILFSGAYLKIWSI